MERQMFRDGGVAFPDYSGDGQVTQKDILMGRGVLPRPMQEGGEPTMPPMPPDMGMPASAPPVVPQGPVGDLETAALSGASNLDPAVMESMLADAAANFGNLDNAEDFEQVMNMMRGDQATIQDRREELAGIVGMEDAAQTPESVLTLVQPVVMIAASEQGIGSLPAETMGMDTPVEGAMAEGIMSTVDLGSEGPVPENFRDGGAVEVQGFEPGGAVLPSQANPAMGSRLGQLFKEQQGVYQSILQPAQQERSYNEQKRLTEAQMLFDIANLGLGLATPGSRNMSPVQRLAEVAQEQQFFGKIGQRSQGLLDLKREQEKQEQAMDLAALQAASGLYSAERSAALTRSAAGDKDIGDIYKVTIMDEKGQPIEYTGPLTRNKYDEYVKKYGAENITITEIPTSTSSTVQKAENFLVNGRVVPAIPGTQKYLDLTAAEAPRINALSPDMVFDTRQVTLTADVTIGGKTYPEGSSPNLTKIELAAIPADSYTAYEPPITERDIFQKFGISSDSFNNLSEIDKRVLLGLPGVTDEDYFNKFGMEKDAFMALPEETRAKLVGLGPNIEIQNVDGKVIRFDKESGEGEVIYISDALELRQVDGELVGFNPKTNSVTKLYGEKDDDIKPDYRILYDTRNKKETIIDLSTEAGKAALALANLDNNNSGTTVVQLRNVPTQQTTSAKAFAVPGVGNVLSYDNGRTYLDTNGKVQQIPTDASPLSDENAFRIAKSLRIQAAAGKQLAEMDEQLGLVVRGGTNESPELVPAADQALVRDAMEAARKGTGPYAGIQVFLDRTFAGAIPAAREAFQDTQANRQFLRGLVILGRSALVVNPRFPVAEMERVSGLFPDPDSGAFFANPETEANKLVELKNLALSQKRQNLQALSQGVDDQSIQSQIISNNFEIDRLLFLLDAVPTQVGPTVDQDTVESLRSVIQSNRN